MTHSSKVEPDGFEKPDRDVIRAFLENLTGPSRGRVTWLSSDQLGIGVDQGRALRVLADPGAIDSDTARARLFWSGETYEIEVLGDNDIWVNGRKVGTAHLLHGDMIEFGEDGPMSRFRLCHQEYPTRWPFEEILSDTLAYARTSRRPLGTRMSNAFLDGLRRIILETSILFRVLVIGALVALSIFVALQYQREERLAETIATEAMRLEAIANALAETRQEALTEDALAALRAQFDLKLSTNAERLANLEGRLGASVRVIEEATASIAFLQGAYGLRHVESGKLLRHVLGPDGAPLVNRVGKPLADIDGNGDPLEFQFTGTGFLLKDSGFLITNRHVARPWGENDRSKLLEEGGLAPEMLTLVAFLPRVPQPFPAKFIAQSDVADLALLSVETPALTGLGLSLSAEPPRIGDEVIVMGYPTGLRALLAQAGREFLTTLEESGNTDFWTVAVALSQQDRIAPLASRGIIAQVTPKAVIYDAETTIGGSGGPALNSKGEVVAVNSAILPEFGGANIGVPVSEVLRLLEANASN